MELNYNRDLLKSVLTMLGEHDQTCRQMRADNIVIFNSKYHTPEQEKPALTDPRYHELARANFLIQTDDREIREKFESIKKRILDNRENR